MPDDVRCKTGRSRPSPQSPSIPLNPLNPWFVALAADVAGLISAPKNGGAPSLNRNESLHPLAADGFCGAQG